MNKHLIWVKAKCLKYYNFIAKLQYLNIEVYEIKYIKDFVYLKIDNKDFSKLKKYLVSYKFSKVQDLGIFAFYKKVQENKIFVIMLILGLFFYIIFTHLIVEINVIHENKEIRELIKEELEERGVKVLSFKKSYKRLTQIKEEIKEKYPDKIDWLEIEEHGMSYDIKIEERIITDTNKEDKTCDIVAKKNGRITNIKLFDGEVLVDLNDYVREGDTLITGKIMYNEEEKRNICAKGEVYAEVWYTVDVSIPFNYKTYEKTGKKKYNIVWEIKDNKKRILRNRFNSFESKYKNILKIFDFKLYLEKEYETKEQSLTYTEEEALDMALLKAKENINKKIGEKDKIINEKVLKKSINDSTMDVEVFVIVEELISEEKETIAEENSEETRS